MFLCTRCVNAFTCAGIIPTQYINFSCILALELLYNMTQQLTLTTQLYLVLQEGNIKHCCYSFMICCHSTHRIIGCVTLSRKEHAVAQTRYWTLQNHQFSCIFLLKTKLLTFNFVFVGTTYCHAFLSVYNEHVVLNSA